jgi:AcrR family transcriptional regulator
MEIENQISEISKKLFFQKGIKSVSVDDIAKELGMSKKTFYKFFDSKEELLDKLVESHIEKERLEIEKLVLSSKNAIEELYNIYKFNTENCMNMGNHFVDELKKNYFKTWRKLEVHLYNDVPLVIFKNIERGQSEGLYCQYLQKEYIAQLYSKNIFNTLEYFIAQNQCSIVQLFQCHFLYHVKGIGTKKGLEELSKVVDIEKERIKEINNIIN